MLDLALNHQTELIKKLRNTWFDDKYKYYEYSTYCSDVKLAEDTWNAHQFVSIDASGEIIGFIQYDISRTTLNCSGLGIINFSNDNLIFGKDVKRAIQDIFEKFHFNKLSFCVVVGYVFLHRFHKFSPGLVVGNPIEEQYDKLVDKYGGRVVGVQLSQTKLIDNKFYDVKLYEISADNYYLRRYKHGRSS